MSFSRRKMVKSFGIAAGAAAIGFFPGTEWLATRHKGKAAPESKTGTHPVHAILIGAGSRGLRFAKHAEKSPGQLKIVSVGEPLEKRRQQVSVTSGIEADNCFINWKEIFQKKPLADVAIITASGNYIAACAAALRAGYHVWVDRPASLDLNEVIAINKQARESNRQLRFCYIHDGALNFMEHTQFEKNPARV
jgi:hypothetical protein